MKKRVIASLLVVFTLVFAIPMQAFAGYSYDKPGDTNNIIYYKGNYDPEAYPQKSLNSVFTTDRISVDGILDAAYSDAPTSDIKNVKETSNMQYVLDPESQPAKGILRSVWDGPVLYLFVEVIDETTVIDQDAQGGATGNPAIPKDRDSVVFGFDLYNDKVVYETDTAAVFTIDSSGNLLFYRNSGIPSLGSVHADPIHPEYTNRIKSYAATKTDIGYNVELALQIEGTELDNGTTFGVDVQICNAETLKERTVMEPDPMWGWLGIMVPVHYDEGPGLSTNTFWSHEQNSLYEEFNHEHPNAVDWGNVTLTEWNGEDEFAFSTWRITNNLEYLDSIRFPEGVWRQDTQEKLDLAVAQAEDAMKHLNTVSDAVYEAVYSEIFTAADDLEKAIEGLRWANTKYPDPMDLPDQFTLPNPYKFFGNNGNSRRMVEDNSDWEERREEILDLAQFYEYGYKPEAPDAMTVTDVVYGRTAPDWFGNSFPCYKINTTITYDGVTKPLTFEFFMPSDAQLQASGHGDNIPVVLSFDGNIAAYQDAGFAVLTVPAVAQDNRTNEYAWGNRTGLFYEFFPYSRNGEGALNEVSTEMAAAWSASRAIDALELMADYTTPVEGRDVSKFIDASKVAVTGFSINGKYAFVSAVFDERIDVCIPGAAGVTGPSPWRYIYPGQVYDWAGTGWAPEDAGEQTAFGTEMMANSIRHNRVRETELFRRFLTPGNFYKKIDGAYGYGTRLPYDQNDLVATLAPRAIIVENTINDYNDGCLTDALSLDLAKTIYSNLGYDADNLLKYNYRTLAPSGSEHGSDNAQRSRSAEYLDYYFYNEQMSEETDTWLNTNPFALEVSNNQTESPYDYYYGGYNTITGGRNGVNGRDGWYYYTFPTESDDSDDDNDNGGSNGGSKPNATPTPTPTPMPVPEAPKTETSVVGNSVTASAKAAVTVGNGKATATVTEAQVSDAVSKAVEEAAKQTDGKAVVEIKVEAAEEVNTVEANLPKAAMSAVAESETAALTVSTPVSTITFDSKALDTISAQAAEDVKIAAEKTDAKTLSEEIQKLVGDRPVFNFSVTSGDKVISEFEGNVSVSVPYTPASGEDVNAIVVYYINAQSQPEIVCNAVYNAATGTVRFTTNHFSQYAVGYNKVTFTDVPANEWYNDAVSFLAARNITDGTGSGQFSPNAKLTRGEFLVMVMRAYGIEADESSADNFADAGNTWYTGYLAAAKRLGISNGVGNNQFAPANEITRQEMFTMLYKALEVIGKLPVSEDEQLLSSFSDAEEIAAWAADAMKVFVEAGVIKGSNGKIFAGNTSTRAEVAQVLYNLFTK